MIDTLTISRELTKAEHPRATGPHEPDAWREQTEQPPTTHQPQTDWWHEGLVFRALPYCVHVVDRRAEILDRRYRLIIALNLRKRKESARV